MLAAAVLVLVTAPAFPPQANQPEPPEEELWRDAWDVLELEQRTEKRIEEKVRAVLDAIVPTYALSVVVKFNGETRIRFERSSDEEKSFVLRLSQESSTDVFGETYRRESEPQPSYVVNMTRWDPGSELERVTVSLLIPQDPDAPIGYSLLDQYKALVRLAAGLCDPSKLHVEVHEIPAWIVED